MKNVACPRQELKKKESKFLRKNYFLKIKFKRKFESRKRDRKTGTEISRQARQGPIFFPPKQLLSRNSKFRSIRFLFGREEREKKLYFLIFELIPLLRLSLSQAHTLSHTLTHTHRHFHTHALSHVAGQTDKQ